MRYSSKDCRRAFVALALEMGKPVYDEDNVRAGAWQLEYHKGFGYRIIEVDSNACPLIPGYLPAKEFCRACNMARYAVIILNKRAAHAD